jgi:hypothetical protein
VTDISLRQASDEPVTASAAQCVIHNGQIEGVFMPRINGLVLLSAGAMLTIAGVSWAQSGRGRGHSAADAALIQSAMSAAPASIGRGATIVAMGADGTMRTVRRGRNGFTCMADNPASPGPDPMCMDANSTEWAMAWIGHHTPPQNSVGLMYMLAGGTDASNTDPYAERPGRGQRWVSTGPHLMVVGSESLLRGYPSGAHPDTTRPYVMWAGTPYAHLMIPVR